MTKHYQHLGVFSDWVDAARRQSELWPAAPPGSATRERLRDALGFCAGDESPAGVRLDETWERDGLRGERVSWSVGFGPRTEAFVLRPASVAGPLPGVVALHDHGGFKYLGKEKIADGPQPPPTYLAAYRDGYYGGRAYPNALAREGFVVLVPDAFLWGSRRFPLEAMPDWLLAEARAIAAAEPSDAATPADVAEYNTASRLHEHLVAKYCNALGTNLAGVVCREDRIALNYLTARPDVDGGRVGCIGLSGGGNRSALLNATHDAIRASVIVGLMSTYEGLLDHNMSHTWMLFPFHWSRFGDWPDVAACRAPNPLLVQYDLDDALFTVEGMRAADERIAAHYAAAGAREAYSGRFHPGPHRFDLAMQSEAFTWLKAHL